MPTPHETILVFCSIAATVLVAFIISLSRSIIKDKRERFEALERSVSNITCAFGPIQRTNERISSLATKTGEDSDKLFKLYEGLDQRVKGLAGKTTYIDNRVDGIDAQQDIDTDRIETLEEKVKDLELFCEDFPDPKKPPFKK